MSNPREILNLTGTKKLSCWLILSFCLLLAGSLRIVLLPFESHDAITFLEPWYDFIQNSHGTAALGSSFSNYQPSYLHLLVMASYLPKALFSSLTAIKLPSVFFDFVLASGVYFLVKLKYETRSLALASFLAAALAPTVLLNSAFSV
jgi:Gpi18-like mannosyltransferase